MKFIHMADLHLGKLLCNASLIENGDQRYFIDRLIDIIDKEKPDAVVISGDVYDRSIPPKEAVVLLGDFLTRTAGERNIPVLLIAGNHDGGERLEFAADLLKDKNVHISGTVERELDTVTLEDKFGPVTFWLMPYVFPGKIRDLFGLKNEETADYSKAVSYLIDKQNIDQSRRNVLIAHQFVTTGGKEPETSESETAVGGIGAVDCSVFDAFDYVALGHIHRSQHIGRAAVRYAGSPLCCHFSEIDQNKGVLVVELGRKNADPTVRSLPVPVLHRMRRIEGRFNELLESERRNAGHNEYISVVLTDDDPVYDASNQLSTFYSSRDSKLLELSFCPENRNFGGNKYEAGSAEKSMEELFAEFFEGRNGRVMDAKERALVEQLCTALGNNQDTNEQNIGESLAAAALEQETEI